MRYKVVPQSRGVAFLTDVRRAVPLVPGSVEDCCTRIRDETDLASRDVAREWLTFAEALELVEETPRGYRRLRTEPDREALADAFESNVFGARELGEALEDGPLDVDAAFRRLRDRIPRWERNRYADWEAEWRERTERLLEWSVSLDLATTVDGRYDRARPGE